jgi:putative molybdopterin biosynthesis protein
MSTNDVNLKALLTVQEVADLLRVHRNTVYEWVSRGEMRAIRVGNRLRFDPEDVSRWLGERRD